MSDELIEDRKTDSGPKNLDTDVHGICPSHGEVANPVMIPVPNKPPLVMPGCPECGKPGVSRERSINGNDTCEAGHKYPSKSAVGEPK